MIKELYESNEFNSNAITHFKGKANLNGLNKITKKYRPKWYPIKGKGKLDYTDVEAQNKEFEEQLLLKAKWQVQRVSGNRNTNRYEEMDDDERKMYQYIGNSIKLENPSGRYFVEIKYDLKLYWVKFQYDRDNNKMSDSALMCKLDIQHYPSYEFILDKYTWDKRDYDPKEVEKNFIEHMYDLKMILFKTYLQKFPNFAPRLVTEPEFDKKYTKKFDHMLKLYHNLLKKKKELRRAY